jgi:hypothetical protein
MCQATLATAQAVFKKRYGIKSYVLHGEAGSANQDGTELARSSLRKLLE